MSNAVKVIRLEELESWKKQQEAEEKSKVSVKDYDDAMEEYCKEVRVARGYTTQLPTDYNLSTVPRWKQDAVDYSLFRDKVLLYALGVEEEYKSSGNPPISLEEFKSKLREIKCEWTYELQE